MITPILFSISCEAPVRLPHSSRRILSLPTPPLKVETLESAENAEITSRQIQTMSYTQGSTNANGSAFRCAPLRTRRSKPVQPLHEPREKTRRTASACCPSSSAERSRWTKFGVFSCACKTDGSCDNDCWLVVRSQSFVSATLRIGRHGLKSS